MKKRALVVRGEVAPRPAFDEVGDLIAAVDPPHAPPGRRITGDGGGALLELALILPLLAVVVFGAIDLGRAFSLRNRLTNMAREGAFYGQYHPYAVSQGVTGCTGIVSVAKAEDPTVTNPTITVTHVYGTGSSTTITGCSNAPLATGLGTRLTVRAQAPMTVYTPFIGVVTGGTVVVGSSTEVIVQ